MDIIFSVGSRGEEKYGYITPKYNTEPMVTTDDIGYENSAVAADKKDSRFKITFSSMFVRKHPAVGSKMVTVA